MLSDTMARLFKLPQEACPEDESVFSLTLHPQYLARYRFPRRLLEKFDIRVLGSRPANIVPNKIIEKNEPKSNESARFVTSQIFVSGKRSSIRLWSENMSIMNFKKYMQNEIIGIEAISAPDPQEKIRGEIPECGEISLEVVLHVNKKYPHDQMFLAFKKYLEFKNIKVKYGLDFFTGGLHFLEIFVSPEEVVNLASFTNVRVVRQMPKMRKIHDLFKGSDVKKNDITGLGENAVSPNIKVAVLDGGIPKNHPISKWVRNIDVPGLSSPDPKHQKHGVAVSSALLFGSIDPNSKISYPCCHIDHYRIIDDNVDCDPRAYKLLNNVMWSLNNGEFDFFNLSYGPYISIDDDEVSLWTAAIDEWLSKNPTVATIAIGNNGYDELEGGNSRIQIPGDCVNALCVGASDSQGASWARAGYSALGPGRSPGIIKPDVVNFGGSDHDLFWVMDLEGTGVFSVKGTSFSAPNTLRLGIGLRSYFGDQINHLGIRTLIIHTCEPGSHARSEVGWGRTVEHINDMVFCENTEAIILYQGTIDPLCTVRTQIPMPYRDTGDKVKIAATVCFKCKMDEDHPDRYTRSGLRITFRPNEENCRSGSGFAKSEKFFESPADLSCVFGIDFRKDTLRWENCLRGSLSKRRASLKNPCFDIQHDARYEGDYTSKNEELEYAMVITIKAESDENLYNEIVRDFANKLQPLRPLTSIPLKEDFSNS